MGLVFVRHVSDCGGTPVPVLRPRAPHREQQPAVTWPAGCFPLPEGRMLTLGWLMTPLWTLAFLILPPGKNEPFTGSQSVLIQNACLLACPKAPLSTGLEVLSGSSPSLQMAKWRQIRTTS